MRARHVVIVTGSRNWADEEAIERILTNAFPQLVVEGGNAGGADRIARDWAKANGIDSETFPANWLRHGIKAGPLRNGLMLRSYPNATVIAFPLGGPGTRNCIKQARALRMTVHVYDENGDLVTTRQEET